jgi:hypothetical protein
MVLSPRTESEKKMATSNNNNHLDGNYSGKFRKQGFVPQQFIKRSKSFTSISPSGLTDASISASNTPSSLSTNCSTLDFATNPAASSKNSDDDRTFLIESISISRPSAPSPTRVREEFPRGHKKRAFPEKQLHKSPLEEQCEIAGRIVKYLTETYQGNDEPKAVFLGAKPSPIPFLKYTQRLMMFTNKYAEEKDGPDSIGVRCATLAVEYIERSDLKLTALSFHRCFLSAFLLGIKLIYDYYFSNAFWGEVGGISMQELNAIEVVFCEALKWKFNIEAEEHEECLRKFASPDHQSTAVVVLQ